MNSRFQRGERERESERVREIQRWQPARIDQMLFY